VPVFGKRRLDQVTEFAVKHYERDRKGEGASQATVNRELATLSHLFSHAVKAKWLRPEQKPFVEKGEEPRKPITILTEAQCRKLMSAAYEDSDQRLWLFVMFGLNTAMRHREILAARYDRVDWERRRLFIPEAKAGEREQPLTKALVEALQRQRKMERDKNGWVFPTLIKGQSKAGHRTNLARPFARAVVRAGLDPDRVTPHTMRHTAITRLIQAGVDLPTVQRISGHKTLAMVLRYTHVEGSHIDASISALNAAFSDTTSPELHIDREGAAEGGAKVIGISAASSVT
jgi:integrase